MLLAKQKLDGQRLYLGLWVFRLCNSATMLMQSAMPDSTVPPQIQYEVAFWSCTVRLVLKVLLRDPKATHPASVLGLMVQTRGRKSARHMSP